MILRPVHQHFFIEMQEMSNIINNATPRSLVLIDELGRGTSHHDGVGIAFACAEYLISLSSMTIFTTHYFELHQLSSMYPAATNFHLKVEEVSNKLHYLYKVEKGSSPQNSYGLYAAESAGFPEEVLEIAREVKCLLQRKNPSISEPELCDTNASKVIRKLGASIQTLIHSSLDEEGKKALLLDIKKKIDLLKSHGNAPTPPTTKIPRIQPPSAGAICPKDLLPSLDEIMDSEMS
mmetsp:Transcript_95/g.193  ORF Transcript_95/g.193 Transcript_95/m.193 type:complete len:235 (-) Transcript_95:118-822(-)